MKANPHEFHSLVKTKKECDMLKTRENERAFNRLNPWHYAKSNCADKTYANGCLSMFLFWGPQLTFEGDECYSGSQPGLRVWCPSGWRAHSFWLTQVGSKASWKRDPPGDELPTITWRSFHQPITFPQDNATLPYSSTILVQGQIYYHP